MKGLIFMAFKRADILLPRFAGDSEKMKKWSVVACDQYTSEPEYWKEVSKVTEGAYSTLFVTVPEIYLNDSDIDERIKNTNATMDKYMAEDVFEEYKNAYIFVERTLRSGVKRLGIMGMVDLEEYDFSKESKSKIRATEGTVVSRIPPRLKVRRDAPVELPHIMLLIDDASKDIIESNAAKVNTFRKVYDFDLMQNSGHITGYLLSDEAADELDRKLTALSNLDDFNKKYGVNEATPLVYAMGDGNHSLATAKTNYENLKKEMGDAAKNTHARYALCELVNLHDDSLVFEAIHRVIFNADADKFIKALEKEYTLSFDENAKGQSFMLVRDGKQTKVTVTNPTEYLTVATVQKALDDFIAENGGEVDYIHGEDVVINLSRDNNFGIILDAMDKSDLYKSVILDGALPRKTFSMGDACDKRFYTEARKIK
ncbi:MAG: DUF1015 domain-containing protein [Ruminococcaceae bacterium]|nr:DUF1015 domain-containing protein [Oscillospiraceae bacterium]